uniref:Uncharacterized protein n=1 Tax=Meloidogyne enterolobii TaxID=390850 RepID=A0A6V7V4J4_MELEN|nr:unnamed protein product [Meloidogyne enterolobii]
MFGQKFCFSFVPSFSSVIFLLYLIFIFICLASTQRKSDWEKEGEVGELRHENNKNGIDDEMDEGSGDSFNPDDEDDIGSSGLPPKEIDEPQLFNNNKLIYPPLLPLQLFPQQQLSQH